MARILRIYNDEKESEMIIGGVHDSIWIDYLLKLK